jgi:hypothetical protein
MLGVGHVVAGNVDLPLLVHGQDDGVGFGHLDAIKVILARKPSPEALSRALAAATQKNNAAIVELLKKAGAVETVKVAVELDPDTLKNYTGLFQNREGMEYKFVLKDGKLTGGNIFDDPLIWEPVDKTTFKPPAQFDFVTIRFQLEQGKVVGCTITQGASIVTLRKVAQP